MYWWSLVSVVIFASHLLAFFGRRQEHWGSQKSEHCKEEEVISGQAVNFSFKTSNIFSETESFSSKTCWFVTVIFFFALLGQHIPWIMYEQIIALWLHSDCLWRKALQLQRPHFPCTACPHWAVKRNSEEASIKIIIKNDNSFSYLCVLKTQLPRHLSVTDCV